MSVYGSILLNGPFLLIYGVGIWMGWRRLAMQSRMWHMLLAGCLLGLANRTISGVFYPLSTIWMESGRIELESYIRWTGNWGVGATGVEAVSLALIIASAVWRHQTEDNKLA